MSNNSSNKEPVAHSVSDHAIVRYAERVLGINIITIRLNMMSEFNRSEMIVKQHTTSEGIVEERTTGGPFKGQMGLVCKDGCIVTCYNT